MTFLVLETHFASPICMWQKRTSCFAANCKRGRSIAVVAWSRADCHKGHGCNSLRLFSPILLASLTQSKEKNGLSISEFGFR